MFSNIYTARDIDGTIQSSLVNNSEINSEECPLDRHKNNFSTKISTDYDDLQPSNYITSLDLGFPVDSATWETFYSFRNLEHIILRDCSVLRNINTHSLQSLRSLKCLELHGIEMFFSIREVYCRTEWGKMDFECLITTLSLQNLETLKLVKITYSKEHQKALQDAAKINNKILIIEEEKFDSGKG